MYDPELALSLKYNIAELSAFKETSFRKELERALTKNGKVVPWSDFKKTADELNVDYNRRWLKAEYNQTVATANMANKWQDYQANKYLYPNLKYHTVGDARVREAHKAWNGLVLPIDHPFWKTHWPPVDWGCRCTVTQTDDEVTPDIPSLQVKDAFKNNAALSGKIFAELPYKEGMSATEIKEANENLKDFLQAEDTLIKTKNPKVKISITADRNDLSRNYQVADICAKKLNMDFVIRSHVELKKHTNPEYLILNKFLGDRKSIKGLNNMRKIIDDAKDQMMNKVINPKQIPHYIVWDLDLIEKLDIDQIIDTLRRKVTPERGRTIQGMIFQYKGKAVHLTREQIVNREFEALTKLK
ncbi:phage minor head protein [Flavobacterium sp. DG1-102-2]|uniref:phage head morphogenesis protein n=1 Tax=Flavobacterium sp. DG1-102-2 TaxID=3081663 RepID=UPI00294952FB|nr:phage minor head protein [Flavobacterium sp. DG1-102-2]MDV6170219.1 phage minor head protein [Flavobacterium sp. DG1-102-2]